MAHCVVSGHSAMLLDLMEPISLAFSAIKVAASIGKFLEERKTRKLLESQQGREADVLDQHRRDVLLVLGTLGEVMLRLGIVDSGAVDAATEEARRCLQLKAPGVRLIFDEDLERPLQYAVTTALILCATCWPMHIHRGFGCSVLNQNHWNDRATTQEAVLSAVDDCIALLKTSVQRLHLLNKTPSGLSQIAVNYTNNGNEKYKKKARAWLNEVYAETRKRGPPQPKDGSFQATEIIIGFASWHSSTTYSNIFGKEDPYYPVKSQGDPGKLLYAYTIGNQLDLQQGQILMPIDRIQYILLTWLEGLDGMIFKLMPDDEFDDKHPKFKKTNRWVFEWNMASINVVAVRDELQVRKREQRIVQEKATLQKVVQPPPYSRSGPRKLEAKIAYQAQASDEISLDVGDFVEICNAAAELTISKKWVMVRKGNEKGNVLYANIAEAIRIDEAQCDYTACGKYDFSFRKGDKIDILEDDPAETWIIARFGTTVGYAQRACFNTSVRRLEAKFDYTTNEAGELPLKKGDVVNVPAEKDTGRWEKWVRVRIGGKIGDVPRLYVEDALRSVTAQVDNTAGPSSEKFQQLSFCKGEILDILYDDGSPWLYARKGTVGGFVIQWRVTPPLRSVEVRHDYMAKDSDELTLVKGEYIDILRDDDGGNWLRARKGRIGGSVLSFYIKPSLWIAEAEYDHSAKEENELSYLKGDIMEVVWERAHDSGWVMCIMGNNYGLVARAYLERMALRKAKAISKWTARTSNELSFKKGEVMEVLEEREGNAWFLGRKRDKEGLIRKDCVTSI